MFNNLNNFWIPQPCKSISG